MSRAGQPTASDYVLHQAAIPSVPRSVSDPITSNRANIDATLNVLVAARDAGVRRLVYAGSSSAYGDTPTLPKHEEMPTAPLSPYALQKLVGEQYLTMFTRLYGFDTVTIRYFNVFGPRQDPGSPVLGSHLPVHQRAGRRAPADDLRRRRADAGLHLRGERRGRCPPRVPRARHCRRDDERRDGRAHQPQRAARPRWRISLGRRPRRSTPRRAPGDVRDSQADIGRAKRLTGYEPLVGLRDGLERTLAWYRSEPQQPR